MEIAADRGHVARAGSVMNPGALHDLALECGATELGDPAQYIFNAEQLSRFVDATREVRKVRQVPPCPVPAPIPN